MPIANRLSRVVDVCMILAVFLMPLWFLPVTLDQLEISKQTLLIVLTTIAGVAWLGQSFFEKRLTLSRSWVHLVVLVFLAGYFVTSLFSPDQYLSFVGNMGEMQWAFATLAALVLLYFLIVNRVKGTTPLYNLILVFLASSSLAGVIGLLQLFHVYPLQWISARTADGAFTTVGSPNSLAMFLTIPLVLAASLTVLGCKDELCVLGRRSKGSLAAKILVWFTMFVSLSVAIAVNFWAVWVTILFGTLLLLAITILRTRSVGHPAKIVVPAVLWIVCVVFLFFPSPLGYVAPGEVSPSLSYSWQIATQVLRTRPLFGSGPGTWLYDYSQFRQAIVNMSPYWTVRFERGYSAFLTLLAMTGIVGISSWILLLLSGVGKSLHELLQERNDDTWQAYLTVFVGWATVAFTTFLYNVNVAHQFVFWLLFALLISLVAQEVFVFDARRKRGSAGVMTAVCVLAVIAGISVVWLTGQRLVAEAAYADSVNAFQHGKPIQESIDKLNVAVAFNRLDDTYYRNLSQAYLIRVGQEVQQSPSQDRATLVNQLVSAAIDTGKKAAQLSPADVDNWANLAVVYESIAPFTRGADDFAIANYQEALKREPTNPAFYNEIAKIHILKSDAARMLLSSKDAKVASGAEQSVRTELDAAAEQLNQAIAVKPDYAPAHYGLGILYERQNRLKDAITKLEQVLSTNNKDVGVGFQLAILYYRDGQKTKATNLFEAIVALQPSYANARWYLAGLYEEQGRYDDAIAQVKEVQKSNPDNQVIADKLKQLIALRDSKGKPPAQPIAEPIKEQISSPGSANEVQKP